MNQQLSRKQLSLLRLEASHLLADEYGQEGREILRSGEWEPEDELEYRLRLGRKTRELRAQMVLLLQAGESNICPE